MTDSLGSGDESGGRPANAPLALEGFFVLSPENGRRGTISDGLTDLQSIENFYIS